MKTTHTVSPILRRARPWVLAAAALTIAFAALAGFGIATGLFAHVTGEDEPLAQVRGMGEWLIGLARPAPNTAPMQPIAHAGVNPFGVNTFLEQEVEPAKREQQMQLIAEAGFGWIRQQFVWEDIEIHGRGDFTDRRNDHTGDGVPDPIDAWAKYDAIVGLAEQYGVRIMARLDNPPDWAQQGGGVTGNFAPPADYDDFARFAAAVAERYRGRIHYYQVWNEPNIFPEWGDQPVDAAAYTDLLCRTYRALKAVDPAIVVISGALSPTLSLSPANINDFLFLEQMYAAGAGACFDVLSVQGYGFFSGPGDQRRDPFTLTFARNLYIRDIMVAHGDGDKAIWISEAAWNPIESPEVPADVTGRTNFGTVTREQAARYMPDAFLRAETEWPWIGVVNYWFFKRPADYERGQSWYYFRMAEPDFTLLPVYHSVQAFIAGYRPALHVGVHTAAHWAIARVPAEVRSPSEGARSSEARAVTQAAFEAVGSTVVVRWAGGPLRAVSESGAGERVRVLSGGPGWNEAVAYHGVPGERVRVVLTAAAPGAFTLDTVTVYAGSRAPAAIPIAVAVAIVGIFAAGALGALAGRACGAS
jgi:hypothetical protein